MRFPSTRSLTLLKDPYRGLFARVGVAYNQIAGDLQHHHQGGCNGMVFRVWACMRSGH